MNSNAGKLRKASIGIQLVASSAMLICSVIALVMNLAWMADGLFGTIIAVRILQIITFCAAIGVCVATNKEGLEMTKAIAGMVVASIGFILSFVLIPASSMESLVQITYFEGEGYGDFVNVCLWIIPTLALAMVILSILCLTKKPNNQSNNSNIMQ